MSRHILTPILALALALVACGPAAREGTDDEADAGAPVDAGPCAGVARTWTAAAPGSESGATGTVTIADGSLTLAGTGVLTKCTDAECGAKGVLRVTREGLTGDFDAELELSSLVGPDGSGVRLYVLQQDGPYLASALYTRSSNLEFASVAVFGEAEGVVDRSAITTFDSAKLRLARSGNVVTASSVAGTDEISTTVVLPGSLRLGIQLLRESAAGDPTEAHFAALVGTGGAASDTFECPTILP